MHPAPEVKSLAGSRQCRVKRYAAGVSTETVDHVVEELPVALVFNGVSHAVMMATPTDLEAFALGFALSEGLVSHRSDVLDIEAKRVSVGVEVAMTITQRAFMQLKAARRSMAGRSGCGVCGIESLDLLDLQPPPIHRPLAGAGISPEALVHAVHELPSHQHLMSETGGLHAAAWCEPGGRIVAVYEDVGRHNALDKLIGHMAMHQMEPSRGFVLMSSRASHELVRKAARFNVPTLAAISAPTSLAIDIARQAGVRLIGFCRGTGFTEYTA